MNVIKFPSRQTLKAREKQAALAALAPQLQAIAGRGELVTNRQDYTYSLTVIGDVKVIGCSVMPGEVSIIVHWESAKTPGNPNGLVFSANFDRSGNIIRKPMRWKRGEWEGEILAPTPQSRTA